LEEKRQLQEIIEQQIFEAEEALYCNNLETQAEIQTVKAEYAAGQYLTMDEYLNYSTFTVQASKRYLS
jgi:hypothetical protein